MKPRDESTACHRKLLCSFCNEQTSVVACLDYVYLSTRLQLFSFTAKVALCIYLRWFWTSWLNWTTPSVFIQISVLLLRSHWRIQFIYQMFSHVFKGLISIWRHLIWFVFFYLHFQDACRNRATSEQIVGSVSLQLCEVNPTLVI